MYAKRMYNLFQGLRRAYGEYALPQSTTPGLKAKGRARTIKEELKVKQFEQHIAGKMGLGVIPIRDDSTCMFAAIDIDSYDNFDLDGLSKKIASLSFPIVLCRSKSGGAHLYVFFIEPVPAAKVRQALKIVGTSLGYRDVEIFPKQDRIEPGADCGNWINLPYYGGDDTDRYAIQNGSILNTESFLSLAEDMRLTASDLDEMLTVNHSGEFIDAPPCLEGLTSQGFPAGSMNNALFDMGVYARMRYPDEWAGKIHEYNKRFMGPGKHEEVQQIIKSLDKKKYAYRCSEPPICGCCNKGVCYTRKYGIASEHSPYKSSQKLSRPCVLDEVQKPVICYEPVPGSSDEPYWVFTMFGSFMDVSVDMLYSQMKFNREVLKMFKKVYLPIDEPRWIALVNEILTTADTLAMAKDAGPEGQLMLHLEKFCTGRVQARTPEELLLGKPYTEGGYTYFCSQDFFKYLENQRYQGIRSQDIYKVLRRYGCDHKIIRLKRITISVWFAPAFTLQLEDYSLPPEVDEDY